MSCQPLNAQPFDSWLLNSTALASRSPLPIDELIEQSRGVVHPYIDELQQIVAQAAQLELKLPGLDARMRVRRRVADRLDLVARRTGNVSVARDAQRLREARLSSTEAYRRGDNKVFRRWDVKAGLPLFCPDDAREEAKRLQRRIMPEIERQLQLGRTFHFAVLTVPNTAPGQCARGMRELSRRYRSLTRSLKRKRGKPFPIIGSVATMECPLSAHRDWHPHLNVLFVCDGYLDYGKLRRRWFHNAEFERLRGTSQQISAALRELIKYSVQAVPEKSYDKAEKARARAEADARGDPAPARGIAADDRRSPGGSESTAPSGGTASAADPRGSGPGERGGGRPPAPALIDWTDEEILEFRAAHKGFRRTRTYGCLYGLEKPPREDTSNLVTFAALRWQGDRYVARVPLLESIPGDKSTTPDPVKRWHKWLRPPPEGTWLVENAEKILREFNQRAA